MGLTPGPERSHHFERDVIRMETETTQPGRPRARRAGDFLDRPAGYSYLPRHGDNDHRPKHAAPAAEVPVRF